MVSPGNNTTDNNAADHEIERRAPQPEPAHQRRRAKRPAKLDTLYVFPEQEFTGAQVRQLLESGSQDERAQVITSLLSFVPWNDIWAQVSPEEVREAFPHLELPTGLRKAWAALLRLPVD